MPRCSPEDAPLADAVAGHAAHRLALVRRPRRIVRLRGRPTTIAAGPARPPRCPTARRLARRARWHRRSSGRVGGRVESPQVEVVALEVPCGTTALPHALRALAPHVTSGPGGSPRSSCRGPARGLGACRCRYRRPHQVSDRRHDARRVSDRGATLAQAILLCAAERQPFKCTGWAPPRGSASRRRARCSSITAFSTSRWRRGSCQHR